MALDPATCTMDGTTSITDYREIDEILRSADFVQAAYGDAVQPLVHDTLTAIDGDRHAARWRLEHRLFGREAIAHYQQAAVTPLLEATLQALAGERDAEGAVRADLVPLVWGIARRIPAFVVGIDGVEGEERVARFVELLGALGHGLSASLSPHREVLVADALEARSRFAVEFFEPSAARRRAMVDAVRAGALDPGELPRDLITLLLTHWDDGWDDELLLREAAMFLSASISTTAQFVPHFVVRLLDWLANHPDHADRVGDLSFLQRAVAEALRFFVASPARVRRATRTVTLRSGRRIEAGETVSLWFLPANADRGAFGPDADRFDPRRETGRRVPWGLAFGQGAHLCIGKNLITGVGSRRGADGADGVDGAAGVVGADEQGGARSVGVVAVMAQRLFAAGMALDRSRPATKHPTSIYDEYTSLPVVFSRL